MLFAERDQLCILDFKTETLPENPADQRLARYRTQLLMYAWGVEQAVGIRPSEGLIYFLKSDTVKSFHISESDVGEVADSVRKTFKQMAEKEVG